MVYNLNTYVMTLGNSRSLLSTLLDILKRFFTLKLQKLKNFSLLYKRLYILPNNMDLALKFNIIAI